MKIDLQYKNTKKDNQIQFEMANGTITLGQTETEKESKACANKSI